MVYSRSPSPRRRRSKSRERDRRRRRTRSRERRRRSGEREHRRHRSRSWSRSRSRSLSRSDRERAGSSKNGVTQNRPAISDAELEGKTEEEREIMRVMGFCNFDTTKGKKVYNNDAGEVHVILKRKYRQYMNRKGGFNRPLDFVA